MPPRPFVPRQSARKQQQQEVAEGEGAAAAVAAPQAVIEVAAPASASAAPTDASVLTADAVVEASAVAQPDAAEPAAVEAAGGPLTASEAAQLLALLAKVSRDGISKKPPSSSASVASSSKVGGSDAEKQTSRSGEAKAAQPLAAARSIMRALRRSGLVPQCGEDELSLSSSSSSASSASDSDETQSESTGDAADRPAARRTAAFAGRNNVPVPPAAASGRAGAAAGRGNAQPSTRNNHHHRHHQRPVAVALPNDKAAVAQLFAHTRHVSHLRRTEADRLDAARATTDVVNSILDALGGVFQCRFVSLLVPDELKQGELRAVAFSGLDSATRTLDSFSTSAHGSAGLLVAAASLAMHHNVVINVRLPGSGGDTDDEGTAAARGTTSATTTAAMQSSQKRGGAGAAASASAANYYSPVGCALSVPIPGPNNYAVAVLHCMDRSFGVESFSAEDEASAWCYAKLLARVLGAFDSKRRSAPDRAVNRALQTVLRSVEAVDGAKIRKILDGDFGDIDISKASASAAAGGASTAWGEETARAPPVFRTQSSRVAALVRKLQSSSVLFTTKASEARGRTVECEYHVPLGSVGGGDPSGSGNNDQHQHHHHHHHAVAAPPGSPAAEMVPDLLNLCTLTDHVHRVADAWYRTAALLAESRAEVMGLQLDVKRLTQDLNAGRLKIDLQRELLLTGGGGGGGGGGVDRQDRSARLSGSATRGGGGTSVSNSPASVQLSAMSDRAAIINLNANVDRVAATLLPGFSSPPVAHRLSLSPRAQVRRTSSGVGNDSVASASVMHYTN